MDLHHCPNVGPTTQPKCWTDTTVIMFPLHPPILDPCHHHKCYLDGPKIELRPPPDRFLWIPDTQLVVLGQVISVMPSFYQRARLLFPMTMRQRLVHVGTSSYSLDMDMVDKELGDVLFHCRRTFAAMDPNTGEGKPLPDNVR